MTAPNNTADVFDFDGIPISRMGLQETYEFMMQRVKEGRKTRIALLPVNNLVWASRDNALKNVYQTADLNAADGVPVVWLSKLFRSPIRGRVTGLDLLPMVCSKGQEHGLRLFFLGSSEATLRAIESKLAETYTDTSKLAFYSPPFKPVFSEADNNDMVHRINTFKPDILFVSLTAPRQDFWLYDHAAKLDAKILIGVGAAFDVLAGNFRRSPQWMQKYGLEWLFRLVLEPKRLFRRYLIEAPAILPLVWRQLRRMDL